MTGLYIREMLSRRLIRRVLIVPPAGLVGNWHGELLRWFGLRFTIVGGVASIAGNPFMGPESDLVIVSADTLAGNRTFTRLAEAGVAPYDLVVVDEAHKLAADPQPDHTVRRTDRYRLAEALAGDRGWPSDWPDASALMRQAAPLTAKATSLADTARRFLAERVAAGDVEKQRQVAAEDIALRRGLIARGFLHRERGLAEERARLNSRIREGDGAAKARLSLIRLEHQELGAKRAEALNLLDREHELIGLGSVRFIAHAMIVPSSDPEERKRHDQEVEAWLSRSRRRMKREPGHPFRTSRCRSLRLSPGLGERPGFDLLSRQPDGTQRAIEVKGRATVGEIDVTENESVKACNLRGDYWLYVVFARATSGPRLHRIQDPFLKLLVRGVVIQQSEIPAHAEV